MRGIHCLDCDKLVEGPVLSHIEKWHPELFWLIEDMNVTARIQAVKAGHVLA